MSDAKFRSSRNVFNRVNLSFIDMVTGHMAIDIERALKTTAGMPVDKGQMKAATRSFKNSKGAYRVEINKEYAAIQEKGQNIKHYTTPGTSAGFFKRAIGGIWRSRDTYIDEARRALKL